MEKAFSDVDMRAAGLNVVLYSELGDMKTADVMRAMPMALLYENGDGMGHWVLFHRTCEGVEFFDSYGEVPDGELKYLKQERPGELVRILRDMAGEGEKINYNQFQFQGLSEGVNTCGRWCIVRHLFGDKSIVDFERGIEEVCQELDINGDEVVVRIDQ